MENIIQIIAGVWIVLGIIIIFLMLKYGKWGMYE